MILTSPAQILDFSPYEIRTEAEATHNIGELIWTGDGRAFRHATAGEALAAGYLTTEPTGNTSLTNMAVVTAAQGATSINFTNAATNKKPPRFFGGVGFCFFFSWCGDVFY